MKIFISSLLFWVCNSVLSPGKAIVLTTANSSGMGKIIVDTTKLKKTYIERLSNDEFFTIAFEKSGCFTSKSKITILKIKREGMNYYVTLDKKTKRINDDEFKSVKEFEVGIDSVSKVYKCTNEEHYIIKYKDEVKNRIDNTCSWHGFERLIKILYPGSGNVSD